MLYVLNFADRVVGSVMGTVVPVDRTDNSDSEDMNSE